LELFDFKLVHEALKEREILLNIAPHLIHPLKFILPHDTHLRPLWLIHLGLFLYDHLTKNNTLPKSKKIKLEQPLKTDFKTGFSYYDAQTDDARLVIENAMAARKKGATILTRTACISAQRTNDNWLVELLNINTQEKIKVNAKAIVNATGPWVTETLQQVIKITNASQIKLVKGSHFVVPKLYEGEHAYILQNKDQRIVFVIPYQNQFSLIGTTDVEFSGDPSRAKITDEEINYLREVVNYYFTKPISAADIIWSYSGVRPLFSESKSTPAKLSRDYHLEIDTENNQAPLLSVFGGKLTTYRKLAEHTLEKLQKYFPHMGKPWTAHTPLPGGNLKNLSLTQYSWLPPDLLQRYIHSYGNLLEHLLENTASLKDLGECFGADLYEKEVIYLLQNEWAQTVDDILWRRSKLGLFLTPEQKIKLTEFISNHTISN